MNNSSAPTPLSFDHNGVTIAYLDRGEGEPILLIHGFASSAAVNWLFPGWVDTLVRAGRRVIALDNRGHGASSKLYEPVFYHTSRMAEDAIALLDHLGLGRVDIMGYSMGARITSFILRDYPQRVRSAILGGLGDRLVSGVGLPDSIAFALEAREDDDVVDPQGRTFRAFAIQTKSDRKALAACIRGSRNVLGAADVAAIKAPVLVAIGTKDDVAGELEPLVAMLPQGRGLPIPDRDHMTAVGDKVYKAGVLAFLAEQH